MSVGVVPRDRSCLSAGYLNIGHACWSVATVQPIFDWSSADGRRMVTSLVLSDLLDGSTYKPDNEDLYQTCSPD